MNPTTKPPTSLLFYRKSRSLFLSLFLGLLLTACLSSSKRDLREIDRLLEGAYYQEAATLSLQSLERHPNSLAILDRTLRSLLRAAQYENANAIYQGYLQRHPLDEATVALMAEGTLREISAETEGQRWLLQQLEDFKGSYSVPTLLVLARGEESEISLQAIVRLGQTPGGSAMDALRILQQEKKTQVASAAELLRRGDEQVAALLEQALSGKDLAASLQAASAFAALGDARGQSIAEKALSSSNLSLVLLAIDVLADLQSQEATRALQRALADAREPVRVRAAEAAGENASPMLSVSVRKLLKDPSAAVREAAIHALAAMQDMGSVTLLQNSMRSDSEFRVQVAAAQALRRFRDELGYEFVFGKLKNQEEPATLRALLLEELPLVEDQNMLPLVREAISDEAEEVRTAALRCLVTMNEKLSSAEWKKLVRDESSSVRLAAAAALSQISFRDALPLLAQLLADSESMVRAQAALSFFWLRENS